jgi:hypothetical protein
MLFQLCDRWKLTLQRNAIAFIPRDSEVRSAVRNTEICVVRVWTAPWVAVHERISGGIVLIIPRTVGQPVPVPVRVHALDRRVVNLAGNVDPLPSVNECAYARSIVIAEELLAPWLPSCST